MTLIDKDDLYNRMMSEMAGTGYQSRALDVISMAPEIEPQPNPPLTMEELRGMGGEPYWHVGLLDDSGPPHWVILPNHIARCPQDYFYGLHWLAYRRKPEEGRI